MRRIYEFTSSVYFYLRYALLRSAIYGATYERAYFEFAQTRILSVVNITYAVNTVFNRAYLHSIFNDALRTGGTPSCGADIVSVKSSPS